VNTVAHAENEVVEVIFMLCEKRRKQSVTALIVAGLSFLFVGCGGGVPIAPVPGLGLGGGLGGMVGAGGCMPIPMMNTGMYGSYGSTLTITFQGAAIQPDSIALQAGMLPGMGPITQLSYGVVPGGAMTVPQMLGTNSYVGTSGDGTIQLSLMNNMGMYPGTQYPGMYPTTGYPTGYGMGNTQINGSIVLSSLASQDLMNQAMLMSGGGYGYQMPYPTQYPYPGTQYPGMYPQPGIMPMAQACISGVGLDLSLYNGMQRVYRDVYVMINNTTHGIKLVF
jgi:hypothetical protein